MTATNTSDFDENGISVITSFNVSDPFAESFDINLSPGTYLLEIFNSSGCLVFEIQELKFQNLVKFRFQLIPLIQLVNFLKMVHLTLILLEVQENI